MNRRQAVAVVVGSIAALAVVFFPPYRVGSVRLPYRWQWNLLHPPALAIYPPLSFQVQGAELDEHTAERVARQFEPVEWSAEEGERPRNMPSLGIDRPHLGLTLAVVGVLTLTSAWLGRRPGEAQS